MPADDFTRFGDESGIFHVLVHQDGIEREILQIDAGNNCSKSREDA
jgi:hypothetical protein